MKKKRAIKAVLASALVALALACPAVVFSVGDPIVGEFIFTGAELRAVEVGGETTIQAIFEVAIDHVTNTSSATFRLKYNPEYIVPSSMDSNGELAVGVSTDFFQHNPDLYYITDSSGKRTDKNPFVISGGVDSGTQLHVSLALDQDSPDHQGVITATGGPSGTVLADGSTIGGEVGLLENVGMDETTTYVMNLQQEYDDTVANSRVVLGYLSFQVKKDRLAEMIHYFDGTTATRDYQDAAASRGKPWVDTESLDGSTTSTYLLDIVPVEESATADDDSTVDPWSISYVAFQDTGRSGYLKDNSATLQPRTALDGNTGVSVADSYDFSFDGKMVMDVEATEPEVTVNAYQNFTEGKESDLPLTMGRYSPTVTVTYADGSKENVVFPWGRSGTDDKYTVTQKDSSGSFGAIGKYDPTHGVYRFSQNYILPDGTPFSKPVTATLTVTPITVIDVTAEDLEANYNITEVTDQVPDVNGLNLPEEARIVTDIVPSGVSLTMPIKGWRPVQPASAVAAGKDDVSTWPASSTAMHSLKADDYVLPGTYADGDAQKATEGYPYWPETADKSEIVSDSTTHSKYVGRYSFETAQSDHKTRENILSVDIEKRYPWLTIPLKDDGSADRVEEWEVGQAHRTILSGEDYAKVTAKRYSAEYVSTVTEATGNLQTTPDGRANGVGQPTLTLAVYKRTGLYYNGYGAMEQDAVFRVWLPNGQELGTGQVAGGVTVDNWFDDSASGSSVHVNGYYDGGQTGVRSGADDGGQFFYLIVNPDDPNQGNEDSAQRETLRRYINLGGWYQVSVCEDPGSGDHWCEPIPVYVPPRRNEYTEDKVYNFLAENAALCNWPGGVEKTLYLPRGDYDVVGPLDTTSGSYTAKVGLPLYVAGGAVTDGSQNPGDVFEPGNRFRVLDGVTRYRESYGVQTTYDGQTGAQPGEVFSVRVKDLTPDTWNDPNGVNDGQTDALAGRNDVYKYGPTPLYEGEDEDGDGVVDGYAVAGSGRVFQPDLTANPSASTYTATLRREAETKAAENVRIKLLSWEAGGITRDPNGTNDYDNDNVVLVTFDAKQVGYTVRQDFTLTIKNVGTTDIYGLDIDTVTDDYTAEPQGGRFEMLQAPASFLPVGATTTFTLTYVYNLAANSTSMPSYRDTLYITANGHNDPGKGHQHDTGRLDDAYLLDFDAEFMVSQDPLHKVTVIYRPVSGDMGTAGLIVGEQKVGGTTTMIYTPTTRTYPQGGVVYVAANMVDEYEIYAVHTEIDGAFGADLLQNNEYGTATFSVSGVSNDAPIDRTKQRVFAFEMPNSDVTVYVDFYEPFSSKLRLENLIDFSSPPDPGDGTTLNDLKTSLTAANPSADHTYPVWRKTFTDAEKAAADAWATVSASGTDDPDYYLMTQGRAMPYADGGQSFVPSENQYLVVIDPEDDLSQIEAKIRRVQYHADWRESDEVLGTSTGYTYGQNYEIELTVEMDVYPYNVEKQDGGSYNWDTPAYQPSGVYRPENSGNADGDDNALGGGLGYGKDPAFTGQPTGNGSVYTGSPPPQNGSSDSSTHISAQFASPAQGESSYVVITLTALDPENSNAPVERRYYVEIHRRTETADVELHYGNSPYGMIMNEDRFTSTAMRDNAKSAFKNAGYTFEGLNKSYVPDAVWDHSDMHHVVYNREAWVKNRALFEPESLTGFQPRRNSGDNSQVFSDAPTNTKPIYDPDKAAYEDTNNLDLDEYAYFGILGEDLREPGVISARDSSGREVDVNAITAVAVDVDWDGTGNTNGVTLLDAAQTKQVARFQGSTADFPVVDLGVQGRVLTFAGEHPTAPTSLTGANWPVSSRQVTSTPATGGDPVTTTEYTLIEDIRPGRYKIVYSFADFDGVSQVQVERPFVILRGVGDVNTDGQRDGTDKTNLENRVGLDPLGYEAGQARTATEPNGAVYPFANIFKYRVCDVNNDRNVNHIDTNQLVKNIRAGNINWLRFYHPTEYGL